MTSVPEKPLIVVLNVQGSAKDSELFEQLKQQFRSVRESIDLWHSTQIDAGSDKDVERRRAHQRAAAFLALLSPDTIADDDWTSDVHRAMESGRTVIPVPLRPCSWDHLPLGRLQPVPSKGFLSTEPNLDQACLDVVKAVQQLLRQPSPRDEAALAARTAYLESVQSHVAEAHPLGLPTDLPASLSDLWTPLRATTSGGAEASFEEVVAGIHAAAGAQGCVHEEERAFTPAIWHLLGDPGSGKSWAMLRAAADLAKLSDKSTSAPLPLLVTARQLAAASHPSKGVRNHPTTVGPEIEPLLDARSARWIVLVDGLDEAGAAGNEAILKLIKWLGKKLAALIVSSRPTFLPRVGLVTGVLRLSSWGENDAETFLNRWQAIAPKAVARLRDPGARGATAPLLSSPQTATLCVLAARDNGAPLTNRAALLEHVLQTLWKRRSDRRSTMGKPVIAWDEVAPVLRELAGIYLANNLRSLSEAGIEKVLQRINTDKAVQIKEALIHDVGLLISAGEGEVDFPFRAMAEHLFGREIFDFCTKNQSDDVLVRLSRQRWAEEPVRFAIVWASYHVNSARAAQLVDALLAGEEEDEPGFSNKHLRSILIALRTAADLDLPKSTARRLRRAAFRLIREESSAWVGDRVAAAVRTLADRSPAHSVPLFRALVRIASDPRRSPTAWYAGQPNEASDLWITLQFHRDPDVRALANQRLAKWSKDPEAIDCLLLALQDERSSLSGGVAPALAAAKVLRATDRALWPEGMLANLCERLQVNNQLLAGGAAIALRPEEASPVLLARALKIHILGLGGDPEVVRELSATADGLAALDSEWPTWREEQAKARVFNMKEPGAEAWGCWPPPSAFVRERLWDAVGAWALSHPKLSRARMPASTEYSFTRIIRFCEATLRDSTAVDELFERWHVQPWRHWPEPAVEALGKAAMRHPYVRDRLIAEWDRIRAVPHYSGPEYPGHALEPLITSADADTEAARIFTEWLPSSERFQVSGAERIIAAQALRVSPVREAALDMARHFWSELEKLSTDQVALSGYGGTLGLIYGAWESDVELRGRYEQWLRGEESKRFLAALQMGRHLSRDPETLAHIAQRINVIGCAFVNEGEQEEGWVDAFNHCDKLLRQVDAWQIEAYCTDFLLALVTQPNRLGMLHKYTSALLARASSPEGTPLFARASARAPAGLGSIGDDLRRLVVDAAPHAHAARIILLSCYGESPDNDTIAVLEALPGPLQQRVLRRWKKAFSGAELPWTADWRRYRDSRPADRLREILFDFWTPPARRKGPAPQ